MDFEDRALEVGKKQAGAYEEWAEAVSWIVFWESLAIRDRNGQTKYGRNSGSKEVKVEAALSEQKPAATLSGPEGTQLEIFK